MLENLIPVTLVLALCIHNAVCSQSYKQGISANISVSQQEKRQIDVSPREVLANQPDFVADEISSSFETRGHGHSYTFQVAKKEGWYRRASDIVAAFSSYEEPNVRYFLKAKTFDLPSTAKEKYSWYWGAQSAAILAKQEGVNFEIAGEEQIEGHNCLKIKATNGKEQDDVTVFLYAAKDLKNLVIKTELLLPDRRVTYLLRNISFDVPDNLFKVLARYRRQTSNNGMQRTRAQRAS